MTAYISPFKMFFDEPTEQWVIMCEPINSCAYGTTKEEAIERLARVVQVLAEDEFLNKETALNPPVK